MTKSPPLRKSSCLQRHIAIEQVSFVSRFYDPAESRDTFKTVNSIVLRFRWPDLSYQKIYKLY